MSVQLSFFAAGDTPATIDQLEGLLAGPAQVIRRDLAARISVLVTAGWRVDALLEAFAQRGLRAAPEGTERPDGGRHDVVSVRTEFSDRLLAVAARWTGGAVKRPPADLVLDGPRLRLWAIASGAATPKGYLLRLPASTSADWSPCGSALSRSGVTGAYVGVRAGGPAYRVSGRRQLTRLRELVGDPPPGTAGDWPAQK
ncbi:MAG: hypothetical protein ACR2FF_07595 [Mycobacteriales bacterium]